MTAPFRDAAKPAVLSSEAQAATLWSFIQAKARKFTSADALEVVMSLGDIAQLELKELARQLQTALAERRVSLKYTNALKVAAQMRGHESYHAPSVAATERSMLQLVCAAKFLNRPVRDWKEGIDQFCHFAEGDQEAGSLHSIYHIGFTPISVTMDTSLMTAMDETGRPVPELQLQWPENKPQLAQAIAGIETMRRRYEETGRAVIDGLAAAQFCLNTPHPDAHPHDPANSELVVVETTPGPSLGDEVARGDEVKCWAELEFLHPAEKSPDIALDAATWVIDGYRYEWRLSTVRMEGVMPSIVTRLLTSAECAKLLRRYRNAVNNRRYFGKEDRVKALPSVAAATQQVELDLEQIRQYTSNELGSALAQQKRVSVDMLVKLAQVLKLQDPSVLIRKPKRSELTLLHDDELLRTFISRVHDVVCEIPRRLNDDVSIEVNKAVDSMLPGLKNDVVLANGEVHNAFPRTPPYMIYANRGKDALSQLRKLGLVVYAGVFTTVRAFRPQGVAERNINNTSTLKVEQVLFLDVDVADSAR